MNRKTLLTLGLLVVFVLSACTPSISAPPPAPTLMPETAEAALPVAENTAVVLAPTAAPETEPTAEVVLALPTSRGSELEATDPATVNIASGEPQLIEFFAFW